MGFSKLPAKRFGDAESTSGCQIYGLLMVHKVMAGFLEDPDPTIRQELNTKCVHRTHIDGIEQFL